MKQLLVLGAERRRGEAVVRGAVLLVLLCGGLFLDRLDLAPP